VSGGAVDDRAADFPTIGRVNLNKIDHRIRPVLDAFVQVSIDFVAGEVAGSGQSVDPKEVGGALHGW
jgi:hypothetical protein